MRSHEDNRTTHLSARDLTASRPQPGSGKRRELRLVREQPPLRTDGASHVGGMPPHRWERHPWPPTAGSPPVLGGSRHSTDVRGASPDLKVRNFGGASDFVGLVASFRS